MEHLSVITWGTGASFGRILGYKESHHFAKRGHTATSLIGYDENYQEKFHILIDVGAPCVENMIDYGIKKLPDAVFITHLHIDHVSDFDKFVCSRYRGNLFQEIDKLKIKRNLQKFEGYPDKNYSRAITQIKKQIIKEKKLPVIASNSTVNSVYGLKYRFGYLDRIIQYNITEPNVWYDLLLDSNVIKKIDENENKAIQSSPFEFKAIPLEHAHAPGAVMFIFRIKSNPDFKIVISGDFSSTCVSEFNKNQLMNEDINNAAFMILETSSIKARSPNHTNWLENRELIKQWYPKGNETHLKVKPKILLNHIGGYEDFEQGYYNEMPNDEVWLVEIETTARELQNFVDIEVAFDNKKYDLF